MRVYHRDSPGSASIHEGATYSVNIPFMPVFNNLVMYNQDVAQNSVESIVPDLAESWAWSSDNKTLTFKLRQGVKWHDGKPFTSADVKCTFDMLMGKSQQKFRQNPRKSWYDQVNDVTVNGDFEASFNLKRPQPALLALLASGYTPVYPCHVSPGDMRTHPIGTGPFKFVEFKANESIKLTAIRTTSRRACRISTASSSPSSPNRSTAILGFIAGKFDMTFPTEVSIPLLKDVKAQAPNAVCVVEPINVSTNIIVNSSSPPFDNLDIRRAMALALDRKAFISILFEGQADIGGTMLPAPGGLWAMPKEMLEIDSGLRPGHQRQPRRGAQADAEGGLWPGQAPAGQGLDPQHSGLSRSRRDPDRPAQEHLYRRRARRRRNRATGSRRSRARTTRSASTSPATRSTIPTSRSTRTIPAARSGTTPTTATRRSRSCSTSSRQETDVAKRKKLVWDIDKKLQEDVARPIIFHGRQGTCWQPYVKGITIMVNSSYNGYRYEDVWLDK